MISFCSHVTTLSSALRGGSLSIKNISTPARCDGISSVLSASAVTTLPSVVLSGAQRLHTSRHTCPGGDILTRNTPSTPAEHLTISTPDSGSDFNNCRTRPVTPGPATFYLR